MPDAIERAEAALEDGARMDAYYYSFDRTGLAVVDQILSAVAVAGKAAHHTENWFDEFDADWAYGGSTKSLAGRIQDAANDSAATIRELVAEHERLRAGIVDALVEAWDQGNATGLDGWVGPGRGTEPIDDQAVYNRNRDVRLVIERLRAAEQAAE